MQPERRASTRHDVREAGRIIFLDEPCYIECVIRNTSDGGALVSMPMSVTLPDNVVLWEERTGLAYECSVRWRKDHMAGLHFIDICTRTERRALLDAGYLPREDPSQEPAQHLSIAPPSSGQRVTRNHRNLHSA